MSGVEKEPFARDGTRNAGLLKQAHDLGLSKPYIFTHEPVEHNTHSSATVLLLTEQAHADLQSQIRKRAKSDLRVFVNLAGYSLPGDHNGRQIIEINPQNYIDLWEVYERSAHYHWLEREHCLNHPDARTAPSAIEAYAAALEAAKLSNGLLITPSPRQRSPE